MTRKLRTNLLVGVTVAAAILSAPVAVDDPTPPPTPYQVPGSAGPVLPGNQVLPPICAHVGDRHDSGDGDAEIW